MPKPDRLVEFLREQFSPLGEITARFMMGGWVLYCRGTVFALVASGEVYLKGDKVNIPKFEARNLRPRVGGRRRGGRPARQGYFAKIRNPVSQRPPVERFQHTRATPAAFSIRNSTRDPVSRSGEECEARNPERLTSSSCPVMVRRTGPPRDNSTSPSAGRRGSARRSSGLGCG
jgi:hypothetical protein